MIFTYDISTNSPSAPGAVVGPVLGPLGPSAIAPSQNVDLTNFKQLDFECTFTGANAILDVYLQKYDGVDWLDWVHFNTIAAGAAAASVSFVSARVVSTTANFITIGKNTTPLLAAGSTSGGHPGERIRVLFVASAGTTAGALQTIRVIGTTDRANG